MLEPQNDDNSSPISAAWLAALAAICLALGLYLASSYRLGRLQSQTAVIEAVPAHSEAHTPVPVPTTGPGEVFTADTAVLAGVLAQYERAYAQRDAAAAAKIWPSADLPVLTRDFARVQMQQLSFGRCTFAVAQNAATARCSGSLSYRPRVGDTRPHTERHIWTVVFQRQGAGWAIGRLTAR